MFPVSSERF
uniref:Uncharacterized protein n=1 Tax=Anguilla anguilla TaxID=7936 RepID=A0A0E9T4Q8_ANGAN